MKFSWKIFFSTMLISLLLLSVGGFLLIQALFQGTYEREAENAGEENGMLQYAFVAYWNFAVQDMEPTMQNVNQAAQAMVDAMAGSPRIRISDEYGIVLFDNTGAGPDTGLLERVQKDQRGQMLRETQDGYELQTVSVITLEGGSRLYLESIRDVTSLFWEREVQYAIYKKWMLGILALEGLSSFLLALWLMRPLRRLSRVTRRIAKGDLSVRARQGSPDEIGNLAKDFNHMADRLEAHFEALEDVARRQEDFIGSFAHELKTPLTSMIGYADMLRSQEMSREEQFQAANYIFKEGKRLEALSLKLLDLLVVKNQELEVRPVNARWLAEEIKGLMRPVLEKAGLHLKVIVEEETVWMEPDLMKTVLQNLLDNGRKAMEGRSGILYLLGRREENGFAFYVRDQGGGIPKEELTRITEAFYMVDKSRARKQGGAGLGLAICSEIVRRHGGAIEFRSTEGKGTVVRISLPKGGI